MQSVTTIRARMAGSGNGARRNQNAMWSNTVLPLVTAAREGAAHAARTAGRERARARSRQAWWRSRWAPAAIGVMFAGVAGGVLIGMARRRAQASDPRHASVGTANRRSTMDSGRGRVGSAARMVFDRVRGERGNGAGGHAPSNSAAEDAAMHSTGASRAGMGNPSMGNGAVSDRSGSASGQARAMPITGTG